MMVVNQFCFCRKPLPLALLILVLASPQSIWAGAGGRVDLPVIGSKNRSGLALSIDTQWVDGTGYRPVRIRVTPTRAVISKSDRRLEIELTMRGYQTGVVRSRVKFGLELSQGAGAAEVVIPVPCAESWQSVHVRTTEDNRVLDDLTEYLNWPVRHYYQWTEASPSLVVIDREGSPGGFTPLVTPAGVGTNHLPDIRTLVSIFPVTQWTGIAMNAESFLANAAVDDAVLRRLLQDLPRAAILSPTAMPEDWIAWTSIDIVVISRGDLEFMKREHPNQFAALRNWVATGPSLWVYDLTSAPEELLALEELLNAGPLEDRDGEFAGWTPPSKQLRGKPVFDARQYQSAYAPPITPPTVVTPVPEDTDSGSPPFLVRAIEHGQLVALTSENPFPGNTDDWNWVLNSIGADQWMWYRRHGFSQHRENREYWNLLIPGVGKAPVTQFLLLITVFVIAIGPVNYLFLRRRDRLYLFLITVPVGAIFVTLGLLCFALFTDGLRVRSRVRTFSEIDQRIDRSVSWSRQTFYAGLAPSSGLHYPQDTAVFPVDPRPSHRVVSRDRGRALVWDGEQHLARGFLPSRTSVQFLVNHAGSTESELSVTEGPSGARPEIENALGTKIVRLVLRSSDGKYWGATQLAAGDRRTLQLITPEREAGIWNKSLLLSIPDYPEGFEPSQLENASSFLFDFNQWYWTADSSHPDPQFNQSISERRLKTHLQNDFGNLQPRSYLALTADPINNTIGYTKAEAEATVHFLLGRW